MHVGASVSAVNMKHEVPYASLRDGVRELFAVCFKPLMGTQRVLLVLSWRSPPESSPSEPRAWNPVIQFGFGTSVK